MSDGDGRAGAASGRVVASFIAAVLIAAAFTGTVVWRFTSPEEPRIAAQQPGEGTDKDYQPGGLSCAPKKIAVLAPKEQVAERERCAQTREAHRIQQGQVTQAIRTNEIAKANLRLVFNQTRAGAVQAVATAL